MNPGSPRISVVIPFYDEAGNVIPLFDELVPLLENMGSTYELIAVDDGSTDATAEELLEARRCHPALRILRFRANAGQSAAFEAGFRAARGELVVTMDGDLQIDPRDLPEMIAHLEREGVDFVYGWRQDRKDSFLKRASTKVANSVRNRLTHERIPDTGCPLKVFKREVVARFKLFNGMHRFFITLAHMEGFRSSQMIVRHRPRQHGQSKYGVLNRVFRSLRDCLVVRWMQARTLRYDVEEIPGVATTEVSSASRSARVESASNPDAG